MLSKEVLALMTDGQREIYIAGVEAGKVIMKRAIEKAVKNVSSAVYTKDEVVSIIKGVR
jgi:hypothetical protein